MTTWPVVAALAAHINSNFNMSAAHFGHELALVSEDYHYE